MTENISGWRARELTGVMIPCDPAVAMPTETVRKNIHTWHLDGGIDFLERVHGINSRAHNFVMAVDDEGRDRLLPWNPRAQFLSGYPIEAPICGNALMFSEDFTDDGMDFVDLKDDAKAWLLDPARQQEFMAWSETEVVRDYGHEYLRKYPHGFPPKYGRNS